MQRRPFIGLLLIKAYIPCIAVNYAGDVGFTGLVLFLTEVT